MREMTTSLPPSPVPASPRPDGPVLITGGAGFIGCNLADHLAGEGHDVVVYDSLARAGVAANLEGLTARHPRRIRPVVADIRDEAALSKVVETASVVFHLAGQVAVTTSLVDPRTDFEVNLAGTLNLLEALRRKPLPLVFASTNKVYGNLGGIALERSGETYRPVDAALRRYGVGEDRALDFHTPYGCSKGAADQYVLDYARSFGVPAAVLRMSCIYGPHQLGTEDQGWVAHFLIRALRREPIFVYGDGHQVRDILHVADAVAAYVSAWDRIGAVAGQAFNLGGGAQNAVSLQDVLAQLPALVGAPVDLRFGPWRAGDQRWYVSDTRRVRGALDLPEPLPWRDGLGDLARWLGGREDGAGERASRPDFTGAAG